MILRYQVLECGKSPKVIDFEFDSISKALDFLMKGRPLSDFNFDVSQYLLYIRGNIDSIVYQVTLLDKESGKNIALEDLTFEVVTRYIDMQEFIEKVCLEDELQAYAEEAKELYPGSASLLMPIHTYNGLPTERVV